MFPLWTNHSNLLVLDSEETDECINFTMLCVFFLCLCTRERVEIMLQFSTSVVFLESENERFFKNESIVGALGMSFFVIPNSFQNHREKS
ncbi:Uncharacterized protein FWK35_00016332 [Aphis craccivora]|uniref:Uncharacterized protein n=1 Tax=Aphis craccivora TaxID=307492 RepID=A0A6G0ZD30_APHCR|nr:Uncharacterized protein FWK35_00016332 [Aphis craccivora]